LGTTAGALQEIRSECYGSRLKTSCTSMPKNHQLLRRTLACGTNTTSLGASPLMR